MASVHHQFQYCFAKASSSASASTLSNGKAVLKQIQEGNGGRGVAIFDVNATPNEVWKVITSFEKYPSYIDELSKVETYATKGNDLFVDFTISSWGFEVQYYIKHDYQPSKGYMTWTLDYSRESDLDDSTGYWLVYPSPLTRVRRVLNTPLISE